MKQFALAGNPNCGKTTLFNLLTGSTAYVGNWPGVTVDKKVGTYKKGAEPVQIVDLPGIYSLSPYTPEEVISRNFILDEKPACVINIVDATNLERNLYLTTQLMEIDVPIVIALNMMDAVEKSGDAIDAKLLEEKIGLPVVAISALRGAGIKELMDRAIAVSNKPREGVTVLKDSPIAHLVQDVNIALKAQGVGAPLFHAVKLSEMDEIETQMHPELVKMVDEFKATFQDDTFGTDLEAVVADARYKYISANYSSAYTHKGAKGEKLTRSDKADKVLTHRVWGIPIFIVILFVIFHLTFSEDLLYISAIAGGLPTLEELGMDMENGGVTLLACFYDGAVFSPGVILTNLLNWVLEWINVLAEMACANAAPWVGSFVVDGVLGGVFAVLGFIPQILTLFLFFSILEDTGYMARIAFILDRIFRKFGLSGRAHAHGHGLRLFAARHDQHPYPCRRKGAYLHRPRHSVLLVRRQAAHSHGSRGRDRRGIRHRECRRHHHVHVPLGYLHGDRHRHFNAFDHHARRGPALHHGASRIPCAPLPESHGAPLG